MEESREGVRDFPSVILLDLNMPKVNGLEFMENYNSNFDRPDIKIYMVTSSIDPEDHKKARYYGVRDIKAKPLSQTDVRQILHEVKW